MRALATIAATLMSVSLPQTVAAQDFDRGINAVNEGDYATALRELRPFAERGNDASQNLIGEMYERGLGVTTNYAEAARWYRLAAEQGNAYGQWRLGLMYYAGKGVLQNYALAYMWLNLAAAQEMSDAPENRDTLARLMTPEQIARAQQLSQECLERNYQGC